MVRLETANVGLSDHLQGKSPAIRSSYSVCWFCDKLKDILDFQRLPSIMYIPFLSYRYPQQTCWFSIVTPQFFSKSSLNHTFSFIIPIFKASGHTFSFLFHAQTIIFHHFSCSNHHFPQFLMLKPSISPVFWWLNPAFPRIFHHFSWWNPVKPSIPPVFGGFFPHFLPRLDVQLQATSSVQGDVEVQQGRDVRQIAEANLARSMASGNRGFTY